MKTIHELLKKLNACHSACLFASNYQTIEEIVKNVERGDWLLWLAQKVNMDIKLLTLAKARCAKTTMHLLTDQRSIDAVLIAEKFGLTNEITFEELKTAADAAIAAAADASYVAANTIAAVAVDASYVADAADAIDAADASYVVADAIAVAADAIAAAADTDASYVAADAIAAAATAAAASAYAAAYANAAADNNKEKNQMLTANICRETFGKLLIQLTNNQLK